MSGNCGARNTLHFLYLNDMHCCTNGCQSCRCIERVFCDSLMWGVCRPYPDRRPQERLHHAVCAGAKGHSLGQYQHNHAPKVNLALHFHVCGIHRPMATALASGPIAVEECAEEREGVGGEGDAILSPLCINGMLILDVRRQSQTQYFCTGCSPSP
jgi:hypothetical protein